MALVEFKNVEKYYGLSRTPATSISVLKEDVVVPFNLPALVSLLLSVPSMVWRLLTDFLVNGHQVAGASQKDLCSGSQHGFSTF